MSHRLQITISDDLYEWFKVQAENYGVSFSGLSNMAMTEYKLQKEVIGSMPQMIELFNKAMQMKELEGVKK